MVSLYDLLVVGGGPAGSATAIEAAKLGLRVVLLEKGARNRDKYCGGGLTVASQRNLKELGAKEAEEAIEVVCEGHVVVLPDGRTLAARIRGASYGMVRRCVFDGKLREIAASNGADVREETNVVRLDVEGDRVRAVDAKGNEYEARYAVIATGVREELITRLGFPKMTMEKFGHCWGTEAPYNTEAVIKRWREDYGFTPIFLFFGVVTYGYFWIFPKGAHINAGMGTSLAESSRYGSLHWEGYAKALKLAKEIGVLADTSSIRVDKAALIPLAPRDKTCSVEKRTLLVGDAAGFVHPMTGEGISSALRSGMIAARTVKKAVDQDDPKVLAEYEAAWWRDFGEELFVYGSKLAKQFYSSPRAVIMGLKGLMNDSEGVKLLSALLYRSDPRASEKLHKYISRRLPILLLKSIGAGRRKVYTYDA